MKHILKCDLIERFPKKRVSLLLLPTRQFDQKTVDTVRTHCHEKKRFSVCIFSTPVHGWHE